MRDILHKALPSIIAGLVLTSIDFTVGAYLSTGVLDILSGPTKRLLEWLIPCFLLAIAVVLVFTARKPSSLSPASSIPRFGWLAKTICFGALAINVFLAAYAYATKEPLAFKVRLVQRERFLDADVFHISFTLENSQKEPLYLNGSYLFYRDLVEAGAPKPSHALTVSRFNDRVDIGVGGVGLSEQVPIVLPHKANVRVRNVRILFPPAEHYDEDWISVSSIQHNSFLSPPQEIQPHDSHGPKQLQKNPYPDLYPTFQIFKGDRLRLEPHEQTDYDLSIAIHRPSLSEIANSIDLQMEMFVVVKFERRLNDEGYVFIRLPLLLFRDRS